MIKTVLILFVFLFLFFSIENINYEGCWADIKETVESASGEITATIDKGDWVCVNIQNMDYERAVEVCKHETFHEIWAECGESNNLTYCINKHDEAMK